MPLPARRYTVGSTRVLPTIAGSNQTRHILLGVSHASDDPARSDPE